MERALVLSSGGVDSTTCVGLAIQRFGKENVVTLSIYYGQKHSKELDCARNIAQFYGVPHYELDLSAVLKYSNCSLLQNSTEDIPLDSYEEQLKERDGKPVTTYVPFRNGLMLSSVATASAADTVSFYDTIARQKLIRNAAY